MAERERVLPGLRGMGGTGAAPAGAVPAGMNWQLSVSFFGLRIEALWVVEYLMIGSAYLFHFADGRWGGWAHECCGRRCSLASR